MDNKQLITEFFTQILGHEPDLEFDDSQGELYVDLQLDPEHSGVVIGYRGEVLAALQLVLSLIVQKNHGDWLPVRLNVNNYREQRADALQNLAENTANRVIQSGHAMSLPNLSSYERRLIHSTIAEIDGVESFSEGEGFERVLIISPKD